MSVIDAAAAKMPFLYCYIDEMRAITCCYYDDMILLRCHYAGDIIYDTLFELLLPICYAGDTLLLLMLLTATCYYA